MSELPETPERIGEIVAYHSHIYFTAQTRHIAERLNEELQNNFKIWDYRWLDESNGLHPTAMFRFAILKEDFARYVEWILREREGLNVLVHAITDNSYVDHTYLTLWLGKQLELGVERMREAELRRRSGADDTLRDAYLATGRAHHLAGQVRYRPGDDSYRNPPAI